jgi:hypothetical protein
MDFSHSPCPQTCYLAPVSFILPVISCSLRGSPQCIAFKRYCTCRHLLRYSVKSVMQKVFLYNKISSHLCKRKKKLCSCSRTFTRLTKEENYELQTVTILLLLLLLLLLLRYFRDCSATMNVGLSATFVRHSIVSISLYFNHGKSKTLVSYLRQKRGVLFQLTQRALTKAWQLKTSLHFS